MRIIPNQDGLFEILVPFDRIGHEEELILQQNIDLRHLADFRGPSLSFTNKIKIQITTNGFTKFLTITDVI